ncbi:MAG: RNA polymerase factor sigma-54 [Deltaproteobacteria bacterium]|nr:RNA polymerase factor sigma-54 [Deltaproteobacteria bacterium]
MAIQIRQDLKLSQQLVMTPQLQQAIRLLQLSQLELVGMVKQELEENPVLEESQELSVKEKEQEQEVPEDELGEIGEKVQKMEFEDYLRSESGVRPPTKNYDPELPSYENTLTQRTTLAEHLSWQLRLSDLSPEQEGIGAVIIGNINEDGYLTVSLEEIVEATHNSLEEGRKVLAKIQEFDPPGVASRDLQECLLVQARQWASDIPLVEAIVRNHLEALEYHRYPEIAKELGVSVEAVVEAGKLISKMEPKPGRLFVSEEPIYIIPDIYVYKSGDDYTVQINEDGLPRLRISHIYRRLLQEGSRQCEDAKKYIEGKIRSAIWFIRSIHQRQRTLVKVTQSIVKFQRDFLEKGIQWLKPMILRDVADDIGVHESTISRVTTNKYVHTPRGLFELKFFFNSGVHKGMGEEIASIGVKDKIKQLIGHEDRKRPLSDQEIVETLQKQNIQIARRTVSKYREVLGIAPANQRKHSHEI